MDRPILQLLERLDATLTDAVQRQRQLGILLERKRLALRSGDLEDMKRLGALESTVVQAVGELEKRRVTLVAELTRKLRPQSSQALQMRELADVLPEPYRGRLLVTRTKLIDAMKAVQQQTSVVRRASESLVSHVNGLIRTIGVVSSGGAAYGQTGQMNAKAGRMSTLNVTA